MPAATNPCRGFFALGRNFQGLRRSAVVAYAFSRLLILAMRLARHQQDEANKTMQEDVGLVFNPLRGINYEQVNGAAHAERQSAVESK